MSPGLASAIARSWTFPLWPSLALLATAAVYGRGFHAARLTRSVPLPAWRAACFFGGLLAAWLAIASPLDVLGEWLLLAHMAQHLVLMSIAPPLLLLGAPQVPLLRGLPRSWVRAAGPLFASPAVSGLFRSLTHPAVAWLLMNLAYLGWHIPAAYECALRSPAWHQVEHGCFLFTSLLFWWTVIQPWPSRPRWSRWAMVPYLITADFVNTALSAFLAFSGRVLYPSYAAAPRITGLSPLQDQAGAGAFMWVAGSAIYLVPAVAITISLLSRPRHPARGLVRLDGVPAAGRVTPGRVIPERITAGRFDLLRVPLLGRLLRARYGRQALQAVSLLAMGLVVADGLFGHPMASMNLAGAVPWNVMRGLGVLALLFAGNLFCMACPFMLPREIARKLRLGRLRWPRRLGRKWLGILLMALFFYGYERFSWWNRTGATAWLLIAYVATAFVVDSVFEGASFCKYVCPIGQFNFIGALLSPTTLAVRSQSVCAACATRDCIRGNERQRGCELELYAPQKHSNADCTLCMDCVKACPHDNIGILSRPVTEELLSEAPTSSLGRLFRRADIAVLALVVVFASFANAAAMTAPGADLLSAAGERLPLLRATASSLAATAGCAFVAFAIVWLASRSLRMGRDGFGRMALSLLPLGMGMWAAHLLFHLVMELPMLPPLLVQAARDLGWQAIGRPDWRGGAEILLQGNSLLQIQLLLLDVGELLSLYAIWRIAGHGRSSSRLAAALPPALLVAALYLFGFWILLQPMQMRGMMMGGM